MVEKIVMLVFCAALMSSSVQIAACQQNVSPKPNRSCELTDVEYAVYAALLQDLGRPEDPEESWSGKEFLLVGTTVAPNQGSADPDPKKVLWGFRSKSKERPHEDTIADFTVKSVDRCMVKDGFGVPNSYTVVSSAEIDGYFPKTPDRKRDGWEAFYQKHPNASGFWGFSRPGFSPAGDEALLYVIHSCGWLCGTGHYYLLSKESGAWKVKNRVMIWIS